MPGAHHPLGRTTVLVLALAAAAPPALAEEPLAECIESLLANRRGVGRFALEVRDEATGKTLFERAADRPALPASNAKLVTMAAVLDGLGETFRFATVARGRIEDGVARELYLVGGLDPTLSTAGLLELAVKLTDAGLREVRGGIVLDGSAYSGGPDPPGYKPFKTTHPYRAPVGALGLNTNVVRVSVTPAEEVGEPATVVVDPESSYLRLQASVRTAWSTRLGVGTSRAGDRTTVLVRGRLRRGSPEKLFWRRVFHPDLFAGETFRALLEARGVRVQGGVSRGITPEGTPDLASAESAELFTIVRQATKRSSNVIAEHLLLALGAKLFGPPASYDKAQRALAAYLDGVGVARGTYRLENGSGLSLRNSIRPRDLVSVLATALRTFDVWPELLSALPLAGVDGTLRRRFAGSGAEGQLRAKTGTLRGVLCITGVVGVRGRLALFSLMASRVRKASSVYRLQVGLGECLVRHLGGAAPPKGGPPPPLRLPDWSEED
jgi:serine-type D-Ala-D-Ala carboxypeptidase/endopeptidase (penicillin-binding protein 4)